MGIASGFGAVAGMLAGRVFQIWTAVFLATTVATSVTGFFFPFRGFLPAHALGIISLVALAIAIYALYARRLVGAWRVSYVVSAVVDAVPQFSCFDRPDVCQGSGNEGACSDANRAAVYGHANCCIGRFCCPRVIVVEKVSRLFDSGSLKRRIVYSRRIAWVV